MPIPSVVLALLCSGKRLRPRAYISTASVTVVNPWLNEFQSTSIHKDQGANVLITQVLDHTVVPPIIGLAGQVRAMRAQEYATIEHRFQDEPVVRPEGISIDELDIVFERRCVFVMFFEDMFYLVK